MERETKVGGLRAMLVGIGVGIALAGPAQAQQPCFDVSVFAGRGVGDGGTAASAVLVTPRNVTADASGNLFIADTGNARVRRVDAATNVVTTLAGNGAPGKPNDGDPATFAKLGAPSGVALDAAGALYIADTANNTIWKVTTDGILHRFAGSGIATGSIDGDGPGLPGNDPSDDLNDGQLAGFATFNQPVRVAVDGGGNVFVSDLLNGRIRRIDAASGRISTIASTAQGLSQPIGLAVAQDGTIFVADRGAQTIVKISGSAVTIFAGTGVAGAPVNEVPATSSPLRSPGEVAVDSVGTVFIADTENNVIRKVTSDGVIHAVVGNGLTGAIDGPAFLTRFNHPGVALGAGGVLLIPDVDNNRIRRYDPAADLSTTIVGGPNLPGDGGPAVDAIFSRPTGLVVDAGGNLFITEHDSHRVRRVDPAGVITTVVNQNGLNGSPTDGLPAVNQPLRQPTGIALDAAGDLLIADAQDHRVLLVDPSGIVRTLAGNGTAGFSGEGGLATNATLNTPLRLALAADGSVYIADFNNHRVRRVDASGTITTVAGVGTPGPGGDGGPASAAQLNQPAGLAFDGAGNLYIADFSNNKVRRIDTAGTITTVAGSNAAGALGDGGAAGTAQLNGPSDVAIASDGALIIVDQLNNKLRRVAPGAGGTLDAGSVITTLFGDGRPAFADGPGPVASFLIPTDVAIDGAGNFLVADRGNQRVRVAKPGTDCTGTVRRCATAAECEDGDPCTADTCDASGLCHEEPISSPECRPRCAAEPSGCIPGGGPARVDCLAEALVKAPLTMRKGRPAPVVRCHDGDAACDADQAPGQCTFRVAWCFNQNDPRLGCSTSGVTSLAAKGPAGSVVLDALAKLVPDGSSRAGASVVLASPLSTDSCTDLMAVSVPLKRNGRRPGKLVLKATTRGTGHPAVRDVDKLRLVCLP